MNLLRYWIKLQRLMVMDVAIPLGVTVGLMLITIQQPYGRETLAIPNIGGIFYRSLFVISLLPLIWSYRYGLKRAMILTITFYSFQEFIFTNIYFISYGHDMFIWLSPFWFGRNMLMLIWIPMILFNKWYQFDWKSIYSGIFTLGWLDYLIRIWPQPWLNGEGNIPLTLIPQLQEFISISSFVLWAYFLFRPRDKPISQSAIFTMTFAISLNVILIMVAKI